MEKVRRKLLPILLLTVIVILTGFFYSDRIPAQAWAELIEYDGASLIEQAKTLSGQDVIYQGEVIGDIMVRQDHYWINVLNDGTAIGIWITADQRELIIHAGQYGIRGDEIRIIGRFSQACPEHGGDLDLHASSVEIISRGAVLPNPPNMTRMIVAAVLLLLASSGLFILIRLRYKNKQTIIK